MGAPPKGNQPGKPLFGNGDLLATVIQHKQYKYYIIMLSWYFSTAGLCHDTPIQQGYNCSENFLFISFFFDIVFVCLLLWRLGLIRLYCRTWRHPRTSDVNATSTILFSLIPTN
jgi:hypothetical protein